MWFLLSLIWWVQFSDKPGTSPIAFSERAVVQRTQWNIPVDSLDYSVSSLYVDSLRHAGARVLHTSRWMNAATVEMDSALAQKVKGWSMVQSVELTRSTATRSSLRKMDKSYTVYDAATNEAAKQQAVIGLPRLHEAGYHGQGVLMAVCDGGFYRYDTLSCFDHSHCMGAYDLTDDKEGFYSWTGNHGTMCLSIIAGTTATYSGSATRADYYLMRSEEYHTESMKEVDNLVVALEKADSLGVNIFSVSLGYSVFDASAPDFTYADMNGRVSRASQATTIAARKGMLVCVAAGNEGDKIWHNITSPADADSILTIGAVDTAGVLGSFSSRGPSADFRVKPDVCAVGKGTCILSTHGEVQYGNGTSFACPLLAGAAACLWSALPEENNMQIRERILRSAHQYTQPDADYGYGIPNIWNAYTGSTPTEVVNVAAPSAVKQYWQGRIVIERNGRVYDVVGREVSGER